MHFKMWNSLATPPVVEEANQSRKSDVAAGHVCLSPLVRRAALFAGMWIAAICLMLVWSPTTYAAGAVYYVDCSAGRDTYAGTSQSQAWQSLNRANNATLGAGDTLLLKRGCAWNGPLRANWSGTSAQPVLISAYGSGALPIIRVTNDLPTGVVISGSNQIIEFIETRGSSNRRDASCGNQTMGWLTGFEMRGAASYNTIRRSVATGMTAGINFHDESHHNKILSNSLVNNSVMSVLTPVGVSPYDDLGAFGIILKGYDQEVAYNTFQNNNSWCSYDEGFQGNSIEVFGARRSTIHHNRSLNDKVFSELGGGSIKADGVTFAYNQFSSSAANARFIIVRGGQNSYGPTWRTNVYNNTVHLTHAQSQGVVCHAGCSRDILTMTNNIIWANEKAAFADGLFTEQNNLYWSNNGNPVVQLQGFNLNSASALANPQFVNSGAQDFRLGSASPARDRGIWAGPYQRDLFNQRVGQGNGVDIGVAEFVVE